jgi:Zn-dependent M28 family amino/carboxypeptidase
MRTLLNVALALIVVLVAWYGTTRYLTQAPEYDVLGPLPPLGAQEQERVPRLKAHVAALASGERNIGHYDQLEKAAQYIEQQLTTYHLKPIRHEFTAGGKTVRNIEAVYEPPGVALTGTVVVGAHYDSAPGSPGAEDNATGVAALLEIAHDLAVPPRRGTKRLRMFFFVNGAPPYFKTNDMGSLRVAKDLAARGEKVAAMYSLDSLGYYSREPKSQKYPPLIGTLLPKTGDFLSVVGLLNARTIARHTTQLFPNYSKFPLLSAVGPSLIPSLDVSDNWAFAQTGVPAVIFTDTGPLRYPHFGLPTDTPEKIKYEDLARVTQGIIFLLRQAVQ